MISYFAGTLRWQLLTIALVVNVSLASHPSHANEDIEKALDRFSAAFIAGDSEGLKQVWDHEWESPVFLMMESEEALTSWETIESHFDNAGLPAGTEYKTKRRIISMSMLTEDLASVLIQLAWMAKFPSGDGAVTPMGGEYFVTTTLRKKDGEWRFIEYIEAPRGTFTAITNFYVEKGRQLWAEE